MKSLATDGERQDMHSNYEPNQLMRRQKIHLKDGNIILIPVYYRRGVNLKREQINLFDASFFQTPGNLASQVQTIQRVMLFYQENLKQHSFVIITRR